MDPRFTDFSDYIDDLKFDDELVLPNSDHYPYNNTTNGSKFEHPSLNLNPMDGSLEFQPDLSPNTFISSISWSPEADQFALSSSQSPEGDSVNSPPLSDDSDSDPIFKYISQILMEENMDEKPFMVHDSLALQATEKSLNEVLAGNYPPSSSQMSDDVNHNTPSPVDYIFSGSSTLGHHPSSLQTSHSGDHILKSGSQLSDNIGESLVGSSINEFLAQNIFSNRDSVLQFQRGLEEARKFLPSGNQLIIDPENNTFSSESNQELKNDKENSRGRKNHEREDIDLVDERSNKQPAVYVDESELSAMFDKVLLFGAKAGRLPCYDEDMSQNEGNKNLPPFGQPHGSKSGTSRVKKQNKKVETVDLRALLILSAQAVSSDDRRTANELLKQIRQHSSPLGDGSQRLAHFFANGLEARLAGIGTHNFLVFERISVADILKAFHLYLSACPFKKHAIIFSNKTILDLAEKASTIHVVDFGIRYGFQWPSLIQHLAYRTGGPPKLRITGIELPQPGFRPAEAVEQTGHRLAKYCERFNVPFEYNSIASQNWETIKLEDLKIDESETLVVNCLFRFQNLFDETVEKNSPRDVVLNLIRQMNPVAFIHSIVAGSYNSPFFVTRFREALFHYSALFDMFDTNTPREDQERLMYEREFWGREAMNVIACEGSERIKRPETYKQWQVRTMKAGFRELPLDQELMTKLRGKVKFYKYHKDFVVDEAGNWMLQGWKGRILYASSCWVPSKES